ncbi:MAG: hypothetical protein CXZ00_05230 [Acidobacteria bacterium]|nr:MAG: hypothetical protein CXZ00_05230 [Acidobacteriota bacterium]
MVLKTCHVPDCCSRMRAGAWESPLGINVCPRWIWEKLGLRPEVGQHVALSFSALLALISSPLLMRLPHVCLMKKIFGMPCPGCGILHSLAALLHFDFVHAVQSNPAGIAVASAFLSQIAVGPVAVFWAEARSGADMVSRVASRIGWTALMSVWLLRLSH